MFSKVKVIGFDADDTLWDNEPFYRETEHEFCNLLKDFLPEDELTRELFKTEVNNLELYGYGVKAFTLSLIETAIRISGGKVSASTLNGIISLGKEQLNRPLRLIDNVNAVLEKLKPSYKLIVATKGDLLDQERKLHKSNLAGYFHHIEIMSDKKENNYRELLNRLDIKPEEFLMVGNSIKSDIIPVINLGGYGVFVPYPITWQHEYVNEPEVRNGKYFKINSLADLIPLFGKK
ncbi:MAG: HAD family hydrolase [Bacteroidales bacterium]